MVSCSRLEVTELLHRARLGRMFTLELRSAGQRLRLLSLELLRREALLAAECIQRLEVEERVGLLRTEQSCWASVQALLACHSVWLRLQRLRPEELAARRAIVADARSSRATLFKLCREPLLRRDLAATEEFERGVLCHSLGLTYEEQRRRQAVEAEAEAEQPNVDAWLLQTAAQRERLWLQACQRLQRAEIVERRRLVVRRQPAIYRAKQQCLRPLLQQHLAALQRREAKARKLIAALETLPRALLSAQRTLHVTMQRRRSVVAAAEQREWQWLGRTVSCALEAYTSRQVIVAEQEAEWLAFMHSAIPIATRCQTAALQVEEMRQRASLTGQWFVGYRWLVLSTFRMAEDETTIRSSICRQYNLATLLFALQRQELDQRSYSLHCALQGLEALRRQCGDQAACLRGWELGRHRIGHERAAEQNGLLQLQCQEQQALRRQELHRQCCGFLQFLFRCSDMEAEECRARTLLHTEHRAAFAVIQRWWDVLDRFERLLSTTRTALVHAEEQDRHDLCRAAGVDLRMAKVSADLRVAQESRAREGAEHTRGLVRRSFLAVPMDDVNRPPISPSSRLSVRRGSPGHSTGHRTPHRSPRLPIPLS
eukprot:EG_transcript_2764